MGIDLLKQRIITALFLAPIAILGIFFLPTSGLAIALTIIFFISAYEWAGLITQKLFSRMVYTTSFCVLWGVGYLFFHLTSLAHSSSIFYLFVIAGIFWLIALVLVLSYSHTNQLLHRSILFKWAAGLLALLPFGWSVLTLRSVSIDPSVGAGWVVYVLLLVWAADSGAYFTGRQFGRLKLAPKVSPKKTVEGLAGGLILAMVVCFITLTFFKPHVQSAWVFAGCSLLTALASVIGDLFESMLKRDAGIKDSGTLLPGHGGLLDRIDSLTAALPVFTLCYLLWITS
ncbi:MAG: Phosphatidate cytidylyltransferase [Candidatus Celerinatantimonas neptuna]|nr:MAG: Phosphatidate cytidylyltransferase [Candidatus Celerinatantimonas neptuna]